MDRSLEIVEVGPRDGLQSEPVVLDAPDRVELIRRCLEAGVRRIEAVSFVHPGLVPQMAGAEEVMEALGEPSGVSTIGLVLNRRGLERALATTVDEINFVTAASEGYSQHNQRASQDETLAGIDDMAPLARDAGRRVTVTISTSFGCPYDGEVAAERVVATAARAAAAGADEIALADTIGVAVPTDVVSRLEAVREAVPGIPLRCHFHNTRNTGYANAVAAVEAGVQALDASVAGFGGSPFAPEAGGNIATEDLTYLLHRMGLPTGLDLDGLIATAAWLGERLGNQGPAMLGRAGRFPPQS